MSSLDVSIIIVTRNTSALLLRALESLCHSNPSVSCEVIVVDNGSTDGTRSLVEKSYPWVHYIMLRSNLGFARANNIGASLARGRYLCLMNSDARVKFDSLTRSLDHFEEEPGCGVVGVQLLNTDGTRQNSIAAAPSFATELLNKSLQRRLFMARHLRGGLGEKSLPVDSVIGAFMVIPATLWQEIGGFDERYFFYFEETDFCTRVRAKGLRVDHLRDVEVWHDQGASANRVRPRARIEYWRSRYTYFSVHGGRPKRSLLMALLLSRLLLTLPFNVVLAGPSPRVRRKLKEQVSILAWHLRGCPAKAGLSAQT